MGKYVACICEGGAERAILDLLLDADRLIFKREDLIEEKLLRCRNARDFEREYLGKSYSGKITLYRILDSRSENFPLRKAYEHKVDVINVITAPEIEMLIICNEGKYADFSKYKSDMKPSEYCKSVLGYSDVKKYDFVKEYFGDIEVLIRALHEYRRVSKSRAGEKTIWELVL